MTDQDIIDINLREIEKWGKDYFYFAENVLGMRASEPLDELKGKVFDVTINGRKRQVMLFDMHGRLVHPNLRIYKKKHFKHQDKKEFKGYYKGKAYTWQQTVILTAYNRAIATFDKDSYDIRERFISVVSGHGIGKCLGYGTPVMMSDGSIKPVQNIKQGELLMGDDSTPRKVLNTVRGREEMYRVQYKDGSFYDVNKSHILSLVATQTHGKQKTGDIVNITVEDYLKWSDRKKRTHAGYKRKVILPDKNLKIDPYLLGLWLGDGASKSAKIFNTDEEVISYLKSLGITGERIDPRTGCWEATVTNLQKNLKLIGVFGNKHIPEEYLISSVEQRLGLLAGLLDSDGYLHDGAQYEIIQKNKTLALGIVRLAQSVGCHATIKQIKKSSQNGTEGIYWRINISRNTRQIPIKVERKKAKGNTQRGNLHYAITVSPLGEGDYYGFSIDGNRLFMLGDCTVTHNTATLANISLHFLLSYMGSQAAATANTEQQIKDVFLKEFAIWRRKLPEYLQPNVVQNDDRIVIAGDKDWFLKAIVARPEKPESIAGIHSQVGVLFIFDEASAIHNKIFEVAKGALTGENFICLYISNGTRAEGEFYESHKAGSGFTALQFSSRESPIVKDGFIEKMEADYPSNGDQHSDEVRIRVDGEFPSTSEMDDKGWVPLFANVTLRFEPEQMQKFGACILSLDPAGEGKDTSSCGIRDSIYLKEVFNEKVSEPKHLARKVETIMDIYHINANDVAIDGFGEGAKVIAEINTKVGESVNAVMTDKAREETKDRFKNFNAELSWRFREWVIRGGIIITNRPKAWEKELGDIRYRRTGTGQIEIMGKREFKKTFGYSPDRFDMAKYSFFKDQAYVPPVLSKEQLEAKEAMEFLKKAQEQSTAVGDNYSSM